MIPSQLLGLCQDEHVVYVDDQSHTQLSELGSDGLQGLGEDPGGACEAKGQTLELVSSVLEREYEECSVLFSDGEHEVCILEVHLGHPVSCS